VKRNRRKIHHLSSPLMPFAFALASRSMPLACYPNCQRGWRVNALASTNFNCTL
jgi:hypothetical protein